MQMTMMDVAAAALATKKREHAYRTRLLVGLTTIVLTLILTILITFQSLMISKRVNNSNFRLLGLRDLCGGERDDDCRNDPNKDKPGLCGCGVPNTDTDGDGTPDCKDSCLHDGSKMSPDVCRCGHPDTDMDGDGTPDCCDGCPRDAHKTRSGTCGCGRPNLDVNVGGMPDCCINNDSSILSLCANWHPLECGGCTKDNYRIWKDCSDIGRSTNTLE